ncbi:Sec34-domain-containing protein [Crucibulum laeve]|uniref:Conserved oligomeric Golgi complex subunit 3 n=1 Tax=Crucibulum laeve TaxID=68775 RepID=A0A5C3MHC2_9AGAR|nr:Sec34-domain-containing protein [Crucibulum laeve]
MSSSNRNAGRRGPPPLSVQQKQVISIEEWEAKAPLGDVELRSVAAIKAASEQKPLPLKFTAQEAGPSRVSTPKLGPGSRPGTPSASSLPHGRTQVHALHPKQPVQTPQQFYDWFALIDRSVAHSQEAHFRAHVANVSEHLQTCDLLVERIEDVEALVDKMMEEWRGVEEGGKSLKEACQRLLEERDNLLELTDEISTRLEYFQELEQATRMLNHPGESLIFQADFLYMVERVDICIDFLREHRHFREADLYLLRFQQCMTRAMTLIKMNFVGSLRAVTADVSKRVAEKEPSPVLLQHLLYARFASLSPRLLPLLRELERRATSHPAELSALLTECHSAYFTARRGLVTPRVREEIRGLDVGGSDLVELTRSGCSYLKQLCIDEFQLYRKFFRTGEQDLYQYLENLCDFLYDDLRPRILHEPKLSALCEVCTVLQALMVLDVGASTSLQDGSTDAESDHSDSDDDFFADKDEQGGELSTDLVHPKKRGLRRLHIAHLLQMVLQDAQTRLFFKAQSVIQSEVRYYVPKEADLAYPAVLVDARKAGSLSNGLIVEKQSEQEKRLLPSIENQDTWYPTVRKMVWVLGQLRDFVKPAIFEDIAQEALTLTRLSLSSAAELIKQKTSPLDAQLFLVRHLLILKEIVKTLELSQTDGNMGTSGSGPRAEQEAVGMTDTLAAMLGGATSLLPESLSMLAGLGMPTSRNGGDVRGAGRGIDQDLRVACEAVISLCSDPVISPLQEWIRARSSPLSSPPVPPPSTKSPPTDVQLTSAASPNDLYQHFTASLHRDLRGAVAKLRLYLEDKRTVRVLLDHVQDGIADTYGEFRSLARAGNKDGALVDMSTLEGVNSSIREIYSEDNES